MLAFERRWTQTALEAFAPPAPEGKGAEGVLTVTPNEVDYLEVVERMNAAGTGLARFGVHFAVWMATFAPLWHDFRPKTLGGLKMEERTELLGRLLGHKNFLVRELVGVLKIAAAFAMMRTPSVRARTGYDHNAPTTTPVQLGREMSA